MPRGGGVEVVDTGIGLRERGIDGLVEVEVVAKVVVGAGERGIVFDNAVSKGHTSEDRTDGVVCRCLQFEIIKREAITERRLRGEKEILGDKEEDRSIDIKTVCCGRKTLLPSDQGFLT